MFQEELNSSSPLKRPAPLWSELYCRPRGPGRQVRCSLRLPSHPRTSRLQSLQTTPQWCGPCRLPDITPENQHCQLQWLQGLGGPQGPSGGTSDLVRGIDSSLDAQLLCQTNLVVLLLFLLCILLHCLAVFGHFWKYCQQRRNLSSHCLCNQLNALILLPYAPLTLFLILTCSWHFSLIFCMFQNHHVLPVRTSWECLLLLCCFPFHSVVIESWFYFCDIYVFGVQLH